MLRGIWILRQSFGHVTESLKGHARAVDGPGVARVDAASICTSLIKLVEQGPDHKFIYGRDIARHPLILGDEGAVTLVEVGEELRDRYHPGERYVIQPAVDHAVKAKAAVRAPKPAATISADNFQEGRRPAAKKAPLNRRGSEKSVCSILTKRK